MTSFLAHWSAREALKGAAFTAATVLVLPMLASYRIRSLALGPDRALEGSTQALACLPGLTGQYIRRAFLARTLRQCHHSVTVEFGTIFSQTGATLGENAYVGPRCHLGLVHIERDVMLAAGVHVPSGRHTHGSANLDVPVRDQMGVRTAVRIGEGSWIGSAAVVMADVGANTIVGAGAVVVRPLPELVVAGGVPARVLRSRASALERLG
jgi:acetyltransferase-like isoleucine patch superfamily enzyme